MQFRNMRYQVKLFICYSIVASIMLAVASFGFYIYSTNSIERDAIHNLDNLSIKVIDQSDLILEKMDSLALQVMYNPEIIQVFKNISKSNVDENYFYNDVHTTQKIINTLASINGPNFSALRFSIYNHSGDYISHGILPDSPSAVRTYLNSNRNKEIQALLNTSKENKLIIPPHPDFWENKEQSILISILRPLTDLSTNNSYGIVEVQQPYNVIEKLFNFDRESSIKFYLLSSNEELIYPVESLQSNSDYHEAYLKTLTSSDKGNSVMINDQNNDKEILVWRKSEYSGWTVVLVESYSRLITAAKTLRNITLIIGIGMLAMTFGVIYLLSIQLTKPLKQLSKSIHSVNLANLSIELDTEPTNNEISQLNEAFEIMFSRLKYAISQEINSHMLALQAQINPHFLYNVLSIISSAGQEAGSVKVMDMCRKLSDMLRYVSDFDNANSTISAEIEHSCNYLDLMKQRYEDMFSYKVNIIDEISLNTKIPVLVLQPLVENCFQHGFYSVEPPWFVSITIGRGNDSWFIEVQDNGCGFSENSIEEINNKIEEFTQNPSKYIKGMKFGGLGLLNTFIRLSLFYGDSNTFKIENILPTGTKITIGGRIV